MAKRGKGKLAPTNRMGSLSSKAFSGNLDGQRPEDNKRIVKAAKKVNAESGVTASKKSVKRSRKQNNKNG